MRFERRDFDDWFHSRRLPERIPLALMMLLALAAGLGLGAMIWTGHEAPSGREGLDALAPPPGGEVQQTAAASDVVPLPMEEMTVIEPVQTAEPHITEADLRAYERAIFEEVNKRRIENGLRALIWDDRVATAARFHSSDMAQRNYFEHADPEGVRAGQRLRDVGVMTNKWAENILQSNIPFRSVDNVNGWMNSKEGHRDAILGQYHFTGVGIAINSGIFYITQNFIT